MLKFWLVLLLVLNAAVLAWQWDAFARWGHGPQQQREPARLQQQLHPEALKFEVMPPASVTPPPTSPARRQRLAPSRRCQRPGDRQPCARVARPHPVGPTGGAPMTFYSRR